MSHVTRMNESCHTYEWVMSHVWMSHVTRMNESCHTYEWVMSHVWMSHVTHIQMSRRHKWVMWDMTHSYVWHDSFIWCQDDTNEWVIWHTWMCDFSCTWMRHVTQINAFCAFDIYEWVMSHMLAMSRMLSSPVTRMNESYHMNARVMSHVWMRHVTYIHAAYTNESCHRYEWVITYEWVISRVHARDMSHTLDCVLRHIRMSLVTCTNEACHVYERGMLRT